MPWVRTIARVSITAWLLKEASGYVCLWFDILLLHGCCCSNVCVQGGAQQACFGQDVCKPFVKLFGKINRKPDHAVWLNHGSTRNKRAIRSFRISHLIHIPPFLVQILKICVRRLDWNPTSKAFHDAFAKLGLFMNKCHSVSIFGFGLTHKAQLSLVNGSVGKTTFHHESMRFCTPDKAAVCATTCRKKICSRSKVVGFFSPKNVR